MQQRHRLCAAQWCWGKGLCCSLGQPGSSRALHPVGPLGSVPPHSCHHPAQTPPANTQPRPVERQLLLTSAKISFLAVSAVTPWAREQNKEAT